MDDKRLVARARAGDNAARQQLVLQHGRQLFALACRLMGADDAEARDMVQETFLAAFDGGWSRFRGDASARTWLCAILVNHIRKLRRYRLPRQAQTLDDLAGRPVDSASASPAIQVEQKLDVAAMLDSLPHEYREVIVLRELQGMSHEQMAQVLRISPRAAETRLTRARRYLREKFAGYFD